MPQHELVSVTLRGAPVRGVHHATDPESGWVSVLVVGSPPRLLVVRPDAVTFLGETCSSPPILRAGNAGAGSRADRDEVALSAGEVAGGFNRRGMDAKVVDTEVHLLDGALKIRAPFGDDDISTSNETILAKVGPLLSEIRKEAVGRRKEGMDE